MFEDRQRFKESMNTIDEEATFLSCYAFTFDEG